MTSKLAITTLSFVLLAQAGCVPPPEIRTATPFSLKDFEPYKAKGTGKIYGQAFLKTRGGDVKVAAGNAVELWPATPFLKEVRAHKDAGYVVTNLTPEVVEQMRPYKRESLADAQGNHEFTNLPQGDYLLEVHITWEIPSQSGLQTTGGLVYKFVTLGEGQVMKVILTR